ncbi:MAG: hypothetical protein Q7V56_17085 [Gammaproteobacteria bacterium]|nr:hypothetical protein [Gammaproteobacteria bacterium]
MGYLIYASLDNGKSTLKVVDAVTRKTCLNWHCRVQPSEDERAAQK